MGDGYIADRTSIREGSEDEQRAFESTLRHAIGIDTFPDFTRIGAVHSLDIATRTNSREHKRIADRAITRIVREVSSAEEPPDGFSDSA